LFEESRWEKLSTKQKLVIIDGKSVLYRGYYAMQNLANSQGVPTGGVHGFAIMALEILKRLEPDFVIVAWDKPKTNIRARRKIYDKYKANRKPMPEDLRIQIPLLKKMLEAFSWPLIEIDDFEADDIMATLALQATKQKVHTTLVTSDLDILQAIDGHADVLLLKRGLTHTVSLDRKAFTNEYGMSPEQFIDYKALKGDSSDNVPGVAGVGDKTSRQLIQKYGSINEVYKNLDEIKPSLTQKLQKSKEMAYLSRKLLEIRFDVPIKLDLKAASSDANAQAIYDIFGELEFRRLQEQLPENMKRHLGTKTSPSQVDKVSNKATVKVQIIELKTEADLAKLKLKKRVMLYPVLDENIATRLPKLHELTISTTKEESYKLTNLNLAQDLFKLLEEHTLIGYDLKSLFKAEPTLNTKNVFDLAIASSVLNPLLRFDNIEDLARLMLNEDIHVEQDLFGENVSSQVIPVLWKLLDKVEAELKKINKLKVILDDIEWPILPVLSKMEFLGILIDPKYLGQMSIKFNKRVTEIEKLIYNEAKEEFNIASPNQLQIVLFEKLQLPKENIKKTKTGYSTAASELTKLRGLHPVIDLISEHREITKLLNTYIEPLPKLIDQANRLHTTFNQIGSQTGRLSSDHPNLMNIPVRTEMGRDIRNAFVAGRGNVYISADYSQFELRLAAVLSEDTNMIHAFNKGIDIHTLTAAEMYDIEAEAVTKAQRSSAKTVNFGVMYGLSAHGLSVASGMSMQEAKSFIKKYFEARKPLVEYLNKLKEKAKSDGYVETIFGRRRPMPDIHSANFVVRSAAERAAMNMPIQGTEADLMKMAMINVHEYLEKQNYYAKLLLQIHDSILVECSEENSRDVASKIQSLMEAIYPKLGVSLKVDISIGRNWGEL
jgi:DNA polymerase I